MASGRSDGASRSSNNTVKRRDLLLCGSALALSAMGGGVVSSAQAQQQTPQTSGQRPNILFIMGDDIGWFNLGAYHQGIMASRTPNMDKLAGEGMRFTVYYADASCTAGRAYLVTGQLSVRSGVTRVGLAGLARGWRAHALSNA